MKSKSKKTGNAPGLESDSKNHLERVRQRAYELWEADGCPHGRDTDHWFQAEREIIALYGTTLDPR